MEGVLRSEIMKSLLVEFQTSWSEDLHLKPKAASYSSRILTLPITCSNDELGMYYPKDNCWEAWRKVCAVVLPRLWFHKHEEDRILKKKMNYQVCCLFFFGKHTLAHKAMKTICHYHPLGDTSEWSSTLEWGENSLTHQHHPVPSTSSDLLPGPTAAELTDIHTALRSTTACCWDRLG